MDFTKLGKKSFIHEKPNGSYRTATISEIVEAVAARSRRDTMQEIIDLLQANIDEIEKGIDSKSDCPHTVCYDEPGMPYNVRHCVRCGYTSLL
jgi:hypothetical protein